LLILLFAAGLIFATAGYAGTEEDKHWLNDEIQEILHEDQPRAYIRYTESVALVRDHIVGFDMHSFMAQGFMNTVQELEIIEV